MFRALRSPAIFVLAVLITSCSTHTGDQTIQGSKGGDGKLRVALGADPKTLNPNIGSDEYALLVGQNIFNKLITLGADGTVIPDLAEEWEPSADGLSYTFKLRRNVRWHDGYPFTSEDVRASFTRIAQESWNTDVASRIGAADAIDTYTVVIRLKAPWAAFIPSVASFATSIMPAHVYGSSAWAGHPANDMPIGTGPFRFKSWDRGRAIVLEKNTDYFGPGPYVDAVEYDLTESDAAARMLAGDIDLIVGRPPPGRIPELARAPGVRLVTTPSDGRTYLALNMRRAPFADLRARRAVNMALDRRALVDRGLGGFGAPAFGFYTPSVAWAYNTEARVPARDPAAATRLLNEVPGARREWTLAHAAGMLPLAVAVSGQLAAVGVTVRLVLVGRDYIERARAGEFDLTFLSGAQGPDPDSLATRFGSNGALQVMGYSNPALDAILDEAGRSNDAGVRARAYFRAQEILAADLPIAPLTESVRVSAFRATLRGHHQDDALGLVPDYNFSLTRLRAAPR